MGREEMLKRWAELAPGECKIAPDVTSIDFGSLGSWYVGGNVRLPIISAILLSALIEAIRARDWNLTLEIERAPYQACVVLQWGNRVTADEPCDALLSAYVQALEATEKAHA